MATTKIAQDVQILGALSVTGGITGQARSGLTQEDLIPYLIPFPEWRIWDSYAEPLRDITAGNAIPVSYYWDPNSADDTFFVATREYRVVGITARVEVAGTDGGAVTAAIKKAASATDIASGTALHSSTINLKGTVDTNQTLTLSTTVSDIEIASGTSIGIDFTGTLTSARGCVTVMLVPISTDDLRLSSGAFSTGCPYIYTGSVQSLNTITRYARTMFMLPAEYAAGETIQIRAAAGMLTTVAGTSATIDFEAYLVNRDTLKTGGDLVSTSAQSINSLTFAEYTFTVTPTALDPGDMLDIRMTIITVDAATGTVVQAAVAAVDMLLDIKG